MSDMDNNEIVENEIEESAGSDTLKPNPTTVEKLATFTSLLAQLKGEDLSHFLNDALAQIGKEAALTPSATAPGKTGMGQMPRATLGAVKEDIAAMFAGEELTEEFKESASTLFEAALTARMNLETVRIEEEAAEQLAEEVETIKEEMTSKIDQYLDYVVEQWIEENKLAIETSIRTQVAEDFMEGLRNLFAESYINVPDEKIDVIGELHSQIEELEAKLDESINTQLELQSVIDEATQEATFDEVSEGLAATQVEKLRTLAEGIEFSDAESYAKKLNIIKDKYFTEGKKVVSTGVIAEEAEELTEQAAPVPAHMAHYTSAISRTVK
jgi:plasmid maintenance system antidote protein VapI